MRKRLPYHADWRERWFQPFYGPLADVAGPTGTDSSAGSHVRFQNGAHDVATG